MQIRKDGPHRGASLAEAGLYGMLYLSVLMQQHAQIGEGLATFQMLTSHLRGAIMVAPTKDHNLCCGMLMVRPLAAQNDRMESNSCCSPCADAKSNATSSHRTSLECGCLDTQPPLTGNLTGAGCEGRQRRGQTAWTQGTSLPHPNLSRGRLRGGGYLI